MLTIKAEILIGSSPEEAAQELSDLSQKLDCFVKSDWNGRSVIADPYNGPGIVLAQVKVRGGSLAVATERANYKGRQ